MKYSEIRNKYYMNMRRVPRSSICEKWRMYYINKHLGDYNIKIYIFEQTGEDLSGAAARTGNLSKKKENINIKKQKRGGY